MKLSDFDFQFPKSLIARSPAEPRDSARLMVVDRADRTITHRVFSDLPEYFYQDDILVVNEKLADGNLRRRSVFPVMFVAMVPGRN